jgi:hypothetical protein
VIKYFEGRDGVVSAYQEFYGSLNGEKQEGYLIYNVDLLNQTYTKEEQQKFSKIRLDKKVTPTSVYNYTLGEKTFTSPGRRLRIDDVKYPIFADITIVNDQVILSTLGDHVSSFIIKSKDVSATLVSLITYINDQNKKG